MNKAKNNPLHKHNVVEHGGEEQEYVARVIEKHKNAMKRQISEKVAIENETKVGQVMNSKNEWGDNPFLEL